MNKNWKKNIILFLASQTMSIFGSSLVQYAISWHITLNTQSGIMVTISIICGFLPMFFISPFAGVWADRYNKKLLIILSDTMIATVTLVLAILFFMGHDAIWLLFVASAVRAVGAGIQTPTVSAFIAELVPEDKLMKVNGANSSIQSFVLLVSPMLSGALLAFTGIEAILFIDVVTAAIAVLILALFLHLPAGEKEAQKQPAGYFKELREGFSYIRSHAYIKQLFWFSAVFFISAAPIAFLTPLQVARSFGSDVWRLSAIEIVFAGGMMLGGVVMMSWNGFQNKIHTMALSSVLLGIGTVALGITPVFWSYLFVMAVMGIVIPVFNTPFTVLLQQKVDEEYLGRVFGVLGMISSIMMPLGMLIFGPVSDFVRIEWLLIGTGVLMLVIGIVMTKSRVLLEAGKEVLQGEAQG